MGIRDAPLSQVLSARQPRGIGRLARVSEMLDSRFLTRAAASGTWGGKLSSAQVPGAAGGELSERKRPMRSSPMSWGERSGLTVSGFGLTIYMQAVRLADCLSNPGVYLFENQDGLSE